MVPPDRAAKSAQRWKNIGRLAFSEIAHAPVVVHAQDAQLLFDEFRDEPWADALAYTAMAEGSGSGVKQILDGPVAKEWAQVKGHALIPFITCENGPEARSGQPLTTDGIRRGVFSSLLQAPVAGLSYCGQGVVNWDTRLEPVESPGPGIPSALPVWLKAMFMPGAQQVGQLGELMKSLEFWRWVPNQKLIAGPAGSASAQPVAQAAATETKNQAVVYIPKSRSVELALEELPASPSATWFNPRTGDTTPAPAIVSGATAQFPTPDAGDWLLIVKIGPKR
jgi:collagenase-like protein with putative collagen-binding domain/uncharacterized protein DUF4038